MNDDHQQQESQVLLRYSKLVGNLPGCVVFVLDRDLRVTFAAGGLAASTAFSPRTYWGRSAAGFLPPSVYAYVEPYLLATLAGEDTVFELEYPSGSSFEVRTTPLQDDMAPASEILAIALDTTHRKQAAATERSAQRVLQQAVQATRIGLWDIDAQTRRVHYSPEWKQQLGKYHFPWEK